MRTALVLVLALALAACERGHAAGRGGPVQSVRRGAVRTGDLAPRLVLTGQLRAAASIEITTPRTDAWELAIRWMAPDGVEVAAGERVLEFDNSAFASQLEQKKLSLRQAQLELRSNRDVSALLTADKEAIVREKLAALDKATIEAEVPADLLPGRTAQERQLELRRAQSAKASAEVDLIAQRKAATLELRVKQITLDKAQRAIDDALATLDELVIKAPKAGVVGIANHPWDGHKLHVGDTTQPGWTVIALPEMASGLQVQAELSDVDDGKVAVGMVGVCTLDAVPDQPLPCTVASLTPVARAKGSASLRRAFEVVLEITAGAGPEARPGMSVKVVLPQAPVKQALLVPRGAVVRGSSETVRVRVAGGGLRDVTLGTCDAQDCVVEQGLTAGTRVEIGPSP